MNVLPLNSDRILKTVEAGNYFCSAIFQNSKNASLVVAASCCQILVLFKKKLIKLRSMFPIMMGVDKNKDLPTTDANTPYVNKLFKENSEKKNGIDSQKNFVDNNHLSVETSPNFLISRKRNISQTQKMEAIRMKSFLVNSKSINILKYI